MTKNSLSTIYSVLSAYDFDNKETIMAELDKEINRYAEQKAQKAQEYESVKDAIFNALRIAGKPVTLAEIWNECSGNLPDGFTRNKVQYGLTKLWKDEIHIVKDKVNMYSL